MHELAVCQQLILQVDQIAREKNARLVESITLRLGPLSGVEAHLLTQAFPLLRARGTAIHWIIASSDVIQHIGGPGYPLKYL